MAKNNVSQKNNQFENFSEKCQCAASVQSLQSLLANTVGTGYSGTPFWMMNMSIISNFHYRKFTVECI